MSTQIIPFESAGLPAYLADLGKVVNDDLTSGVSGGFKSLSIKGKTFAIVANKERTTIMNPHDPESPASNIDVVVLKANKTITKVWYAKEYTEGEGEIGKPDCSSTDGVSPDKDSPLPQAKACATCKWNAFGSSKNGKGKACADSRRVAVASPDRLSEPMLLRVPAASLKPLMEYGRNLKVRTPSGDLVGVPYNTVITKLRFELEEATPKLMFKAIGWLTDEQRKEALEMAESEVVGQIIGTIKVEAHADEDEPFETPTPKLEPEVAKAAVKKAVVEPKPAPAPKAEPKPAPVAAAPEVVPAKMQESLEELLSSLDD